MTAVLKIPPAEMPSADASEALKAFALANVARSEIERIAQAHAERIAARLVREQACEQAHRSETTVAEVAKLYLQAKELRLQLGAAPERWAKDEFYITSFLKDHGHKSIDQCRNSDIISWLAAHTEWLSPHTKADAVGSVVRAFRWAHDERHIHANPYKRPKKLWPAPRPRQAIEPSEVRAILDMARQCNVSKRVYMGPRRRYVKAPGTRRRSPSAPAFRLALWFLWETGCRTCEMRSLEWTFLDWDAGVFRLTKHKTDQNGEDRIIPLSDRALRLLHWIKRTSITPSGDAIFAALASGKTQYEAAELAGVSRRTVQKRLANPAFRAKVYAVRDRMKLVFPNGRRRQWTAGTFANMFRRYADLVSVRKGVSPYSLRHGFTVEALEAGEGTRQIADVLGHSTTRYVDWYGRKTVWQEDKDEGDLLAESGEPNSWETGRGGAIMTAAMRLPFPERPAPAEPSHNAVLAEIERIIQDRIEAVLGAKSSDSPRFTVSKIVKPYVEHKRMQLRSGAYAAERFVRLEYYTKSFCGHFGHKDVSECHNSDFTRWLLDHPQWESSHTKVDAVGTIVACFRWAEAEGNIDRNPYRRPKGLWSTPKPRQAIEPAEVRSMLDFARQCNGKRGRRRASSCTVFRLALWFLWETGCRTCEMRSLEWTFLDWDAGVFRLTKHKTDQNGEDRIIPLSDRALRLLHWIYRSRSRRRGGPGRWVFTNGRGRPWTKVTFGDMFRRYAAMAGVRKEVSAYSLRHGFMVKALEAGVGNRQIADVLGHSTTRYVDWYGKSTKTKTGYLRDVVGKIRGRKRHGDARPDADSDMSAGRPSIEKQPDSLKSTSAAPIPAADVLPAERQGDVVPDETLCYKLLD